MSVPPNRILAALGRGFNQAVNGVPSPYLTPEEQAASAQQRRMAMAAALLQGAARRPQGTGPGFLGNLGNALQAGNQAQQGSVEDAIRMRMLRAQMAQLTQGGQEPAVIREMRSLGYPLTQAGFEQYNAAIGSRGPKTDPLDVVIPIASLDSLRTADGKTLPPGSTYRDARNAGAQVQSTAEQQKNQQGDAALGILGQLRELAVGENGVFTNVRPGLMNRAEGALEAGIGMLTQDDPRVSRYKDLSGATLAPFIKFLGETGSLAQGDVDRAIGLLPRLFPLPDTAEVATQKLDALEEIINRGVSNLKAGKRATNGSAEQIPPPPEGFTVDEP